MRTGFCCIFAGMCITFFGCYPKTPEEVLKKYFTSESSKAWEYVTSATSATIKFDQFQKNWTPTKESEITDIRLIQTPDPDIVRMRIVRTDDKANKETIYKTLKREDGKWKVTYTFALCAIADETRKADRIDESIAFYKQALLIDPYCADCKFSLSQHYFLNKDSLDEAEKLAKSLIDDEPDVGWGHLVLGLVLNRKAHFTEAEKSFDQAMHYGLTEVDIGWPMVWAQLENKSIDKAKKTIDAILSGSKPMTNDNINALLSVIEDYNLQELLDKYKDLLEASTENLSAELKCKLRLARFRQAVLSIDKISQKELTAMEGDAISLKKECPDSADLCDKFLKGISKIKQIQVRQKNFEKLLQSEEGRIAVTLNLSLGKFGFNRLGRCLESLQDGIKAAAGQVGSNSYGNPLEAMRYYNEAAWYEKFKMIKKFINSKAGIGSNGWFVRKKLWQDWCYFDDELARKVAEINVGD